MKGNQETSLDHKQGKKADAALPRGGNSIHWYRSDANTSCYYFRCLQVKWATMKEAERNYWCLVTFKTCICYWRSQKESWMMSTSVPALTDVAADITGGWTILWKTFASSDRNISEAKLDHFSWTDVPNLDQDLKECMEVQTTKD